MTTATADNTAAVEKQIQEEDKQTLDARKAKVAADLAAKDTMKVFGFAYTVGHEISSNPVTVAAKSLEAARALLAKQFAGAKDIVITGGTLIADGLISEQTPVPAPGLRGAGPSTSAAGAHTAPPPEANSAKHK